MKVVLLGLEFAIENMGCQALAYSFTSIFEKRAALLNQNVEYVAVVYRPFFDLKIEDKKEIKCIQIQCKKISFWYSLWKSLKDCDLIVDFTGGDSFSDIYGIKRYAIGTFIKFLSIMSRTPFMLGPQTYGPFQHVICRKISGYIIKKSKWVFARDMVSKQYATDLSGREVELTTDVAFSLPYEKKEVPSPGKKRVGINVSGLLWNGGYADAPLGLLVDYRLYCRRLIEYLCREGNHDIFLISHVGVRPDSGMENDYNVGILLKNEFPSIHLVDDIETPMDAKSIIATMDVFIGARMHATIASFSTGVATIPFSYSRKFEGLYGNIGYPYIVSAQRATTEEALENTISWINDNDMLQKAVIDSKLSIEELQHSFNKRIDDIITVTMNE